MLSKQETVFLIMNFLNIQFPQELVLYFNKSIQYLTSVGKMQSGKEFRKSILQNRVVVYNLFKSIKQAEKISLLEDFFHTVNGRMYSFKMFDSTDFKIENAQVKKMDSYTVQIQKTNQFQDLSKTTAITKPKEDTVNVFKDNALILSGYTVNYQNGIISFTDDISQSNIKVTCEYFQHVRFNADSITFSMKGSSSFEVENIEIIQVLD
jgi:uncharacterized protein (TIGR02217 family)